MTTKLPIRTSLIPTSRLAPILVGLVGVLGFSEGCRTDDASDDASSDSELRALSPQEIVGTVQGCGSPVFTHYSRTPRYRAFSYVAKAGEKLDIEVASADGDAMAWLVSSTYATLAFDDDAGANPAEDEAATTNAKISYTVGSPGTYYVVVREKRGLEADFAITVRSSDASCAPRTGPNACAGVASGTWVTETVLPSAGYDSWGGPLLNEVHVALDPSDAPRFYVRKNRADVFVERDPGGHWTTSTSPASKVELNSLAIGGDSTGAVFLARVADPDGTVTKSYDLGYRPLGGSFQWTTLTTRDELYVDYARMVVAPDGGLHFVLTTRGWRTTEPTSDAITYAYRAPGAAWTETLVERAEYTGRSPSLAVDASGGVHVLYTRSSQIRYGYKAPGAAAFTTETIKDVGSSSHALGALRVDAAGVVHAVFDELYARRAPAGAWQVETFATWPVYGGSDLVLGPDGRVDVVSEDANAVRVASRATDGSWSNVTIDPTPAVANKRIAPSVVASSNGTLHVAYSAKGELRYARRCP